MKPNYASSCRGKMSIKEKFKEWPDQPIELRGNNTRWCSWGISSCLRLLILAGTVELHVFFGMIELLFGRDHINILYITYQISSCLNSIALGRQNSWITIHTLQRDFLVVAASCARNDRTCRFHGALLNCALALRCICVILYISLTIQPMSPFFREKTGCFKLYSPKESSLKKIKRASFALFVKWISRQPGWKKFFSKYGSLLPNLGNNFLIVTDDR